MCQMIVLDGVQITWVPRAARECPQKLLSPADISRSSQRRQHCSRIYQPKTYRADSLPRHFREQPNET